MSCTRRRVYVHTLLLRAVLWLPACEPCRVEMQQWLDGQFSFVCDVTNPFLHFKRGWSWTIRSGYDARGCHNYVAFSGPAPSCTVGTPCAACADPAQGLGAVVVSSVRLDGETCATCSAEAVTIRPPPPPPPPAHTSETFLHVPPLVLAGGDSLAMPAIGFGISGVSTSVDHSHRASPLITAAKAFLARGGRLIDAGQVRQAHRDLAVAIYESRGGPGTDLRSQLWVSSKVDTRLIVTRVAAVNAIDVALRELGLEYLNLVLAHGAWGTDLQKLLSVWRGLLDAQAAGKVRHVGVSDLVARDIDFLEAQSGVRPAVNQIEFHPWVPNSTLQLVQWCRARGIAVSAYGTLGGPSAALRDSDELTALAVRHNATGAQVLLRWALQHGVAVAPPASTAEQARQNLQLPRFSLSPDELSELASSPRPASFERHYNLRDEWGALSSAWAALYSAGSIAILSSAAFLVCCCACCAWRHFHHLPDDGTIRRVRSSARAHRTFRSLHEIVSDIESSLGAASQRHLAAGGEEGAPLSVVGSMKAPSDSGSEKSETASGEDGGGGTPSQSVTTSPVASPWRHAVPYMGGDRVAPSRSRVPSL